MIGTRSKQYSKIIEALNKNDTITIISCNTCVRIATTGGEPKVNELAKKLREDGFNVVDGYLITYPCKDEYFENIKLKKHIDTIIMFSCASGLANASYFYSCCKIVSANDTGGVITVEESISETGEVKKRKKIRRVKV